MFYYFFPSAKNCDMETTVSIFNESIVFNLINYLYCFKAKIDIQNKNESMKCVPLDNISLQKAARSKESIKKSVRK